MQRCAVGLDLRRVDAATDHLPQICHRGDDAEVVLLIQALIASFDAEDARRLPALGVQTLPARCAAPLR